MKRTVRVGVFETNSSSVHSLTVFNESEFERWRKGEMIFDRNREKLVEVSEVGDSPSRYDYWTFYEYGGDFETSTDRHTTPSGDKVVIRSYYGYDG